MNSGRIGGIERSQSRGWAQWKRGSGDVELMEGRWESYLGAEQKRVYCLQRN